MKRLEQCKDNNMSNAHRLLCVWGGICRFKWVRSDFRRHFDEPGCTIHVDVYHTVPVLVTPVFLKMSPRVQKMYM